MSSPAGNTFAAVLSVAVIISALAGLVVAIMNLNRRDVSCTVRSLSIAYIVFFIVAVLATFGAGGAIFRGTEVGATAGLTILTFASFSLFVIALLLLWYAKDINDKGARDANRWVFGIFAVLSLINTIYLLAQRRSLLASQPATEALNYVNNRFGRTGLTAPLSAYNRPVRA